MVDLDEMRELLGKVVNVKLSKTGYALSSDYSVVRCEDIDKVICRGRLLGIGSDGSFELLKSDGTIHWCWQALEVHEFPEGQTEEKDK